MDAEGLADVQAELLADRDRLAVELAATESASPTWFAIRATVQATMSQTPDPRHLSASRKCQSRTNARDLLLQTDKALGRIEAGTYGTCESCGGPIGKARLQAFPRATLCLECKQAEERS